MRSPTLNKIIQFIRLARHAQEQDRSMESLLEMREEAQLKFQRDRRDMIKFTAKTMAFLPFAGLFAGVGSHSVLAGLGKELFRKDVLPIDPVVIVGAGTAGLVAAYRLRQAGIPSIIYEGSHRSGGRMYTCLNFTSEGMFCELGGELVDSDHTDLMQICQELGIGLQNLKAEDRNLESDLFYIDNRVISSQEMLKAFQPLAIEIASDLKEIYGTAEVNTPTFKDINNPVMVKFDQMSLERYLYSKINKVEKWVLDLVNVLYLCEYGLETGEQSALALLTLISADTQDGLKLLGSSDECQRIAGGSSSLPDTLVKAIDGWVPIRYKHSLTKIEDTSKGLKLTFLEDDRPVEIFAKQVISAIPFSILRDVEGIKKLDLRPPTQKCIQEMGYGTNSKFMMGFNDRVWRNPKGRASANGPSDGSLLTVERQQFWETSRSQVGKGGILTNFLGGKMGSVIPSGQLEGNLELLDLIYRGTKTQFSGKSIQWNWSKSNWAKGSYSCMKIGQYTALNGVAAEPELNGRLTFAGEHTSVDYGGFMNGAVQSGNVAAQRVAGHYLKASVKATAKEAFLFG